MSNYSANDYRYYIAHHGIKGQKWGKKNGPPYPLSDAKHYRMVEGAEKNYRRTKSIPESRLKYHSSTYDPQTYTFIQKGKRAIDKVLMDIEKKRPFKYYGANSERKHYSDWQAVEERVDNNGNSVYINVAKAISEDPNAYRKSQVSLDPTNVNRLVMEAMAVNSDIGIPKNVGGAFNNCPMCVTAFALRLKGYDVTAAHTEGGARNNFPEYWFNKPESSYGVSSKDLKDYFTNNSTPGSYGSIQFDIQGGNGHTINYLTLTDGKTIFIDPQTIAKRASSSRGKVYTSFDEMQKHFKVNTSLGYDISRLDNVEPNFKHMAKDSVISSPQNSTRKYRNKYNKKIVDIYG